MAFSEFTLEEVARSLGITTEEADLFPDAVPPPVPGWLPGWLARGTHLALISEKARSEFIVVPILLAGRELSGDRFAIFSGQRNAPAFKHLLQRTELTLSQYVPEAARTAVRQKRNASVAKPKDFRGTARAIIIANLDDFAFAKVVSSTV